MEDLDARCLGPPLASLQTESTHMELTKQTLHMNSEKKHSVRYDGHGDENVLRGIYVPKPLLPRPFPKQITISLTVEK